MDKNVQAMKEFVEYQKRLKGDEIGEAQVFCERLFIAFGHAGYKQAGAELEQRIRKPFTKRTSYADLVWKPRLILEMKKRGTDLYLHLDQAKDYWFYAVPNRPRYVVLCNFDEFWIYDFDNQVDQPVDKFAIEELPQRYTAMNFMFKDERKPVFRNNMEAVSRDAANRIAQLFLKLSDRGIDKTTAQRFVLQLMVAMFAEDMELLPQNLVYGLVEDCLKRGQFSYDHFDLLFSHMNSDKLAIGSRFQEVPYFNGGIFQKIEPIALDNEELTMIGGEDGVATKNWSKINPAIFGTIFQRTMDDERRHAVGAHYTSEADILKVVLPTIVEPWKRLIDSASTIKELLDLRGKLSKFKVLDPACGSGNFLYVAYRELARVEIKLMQKLLENFSFKKIEKDVKSTSVLSPTQFYGIEQDSFGVELAKITLLLAKNLALEEAKNALGVKQIELPLFDEEALPLDNLDSNFICGDALFCDWPDVDAIVGNPPYLKRQDVAKEKGAAYQQEIRKKFPGVNQYADYCVYWFRKTHEMLKSGMRAGLVGTNSIRKTNSRIASLDYIIDNGGTITEAVASMKWPGDANVHVSIVNWIKGDENGKKKLFFQAKETPSDLYFVEVNAIKSNLSTNIDLTQASSLIINSSPKMCYLGQTLGLTEFLLDKERVEEFIETNIDNKKVIYPFMNFDDMISAKDSLPTKFVIDLHEYDQLSAESFKEPFEHVKKHVLPIRKQKADDERKQNAKNLKVDPNHKPKRDAANYLKKWWVFTRARKDMVQVISSKSRYLVCGQTMARPIFEFLSPEIRPANTFLVFPLEDDYSYGILQSTVHWDWIKAKGATIGSTNQNIIEFVFNSFPWPQNPSLDSVNKVAKAAKKLRETRRTLMRKHNLSLRELYQRIETGGSTPLQAEQKNLDKAVKAAYGMKNRENISKFLLDLNQSVAENEKLGNLVEGPGLPSVVKNSSQLISKDCIKLTN